MKLFKKEWLEKRWVAYTVSLCIAVLFYWLLMNLGNIGKVLGSLYDKFSPVVIGVILAYVMNPISTFLEERVLKWIKRPKLRRMVAVALTVIGVLVVFVILLIALIPQVVESLQRFTGNLQGYTQSLLNLLSEANLAASDINIDIENLTDLGSDIVTYVTNTLSTSIPRLINTSVNIGVKIFELTISYFMAIYLMSDKERILGNFKRLMRIYLPQRHYRSSANFWYRCNHILIRYIIFDLLDGALVGILNAAFMIVAGIPYKVLISVVVGVTNLAPTFGPIVGAIIGGFFLLLVNPWYALWFLIFTVCLQTADAYLIKPKLFGNTLGIPGIWILICVVVGGRMFGVAGILLAIPFAAVVDFLYHDFLERHPDPGQSLEETKSVG